MGLECLAEGIKRTLRGEVCLGDKGSIPQLPGMPRDEEYWISGLEILPRLRKFGMVYHNARQPYDLKIPANLILTLDINDLGRTVEYKNVLISWTNYTFTKNRLYYGDDFVVPNNEIWHLLNCAFDRQTGALTIGGLAIGSKAVIGSGTGRGFIITDKWEFVSDQRTRLSQPISLLPGMKLGWRTTTSDLVDTGSVIYEMLYIKEKTDEVA